MKTGVRTLVATVFALILADTTNARTCAELFSGTQAQTVAIQNELSLDFLRPYMGDSFVEQRISPTAHEVGRIVRLMKAWRLPESEIGLAKMKVELQNAREILGLSRYSSVLDALEATPTDRMGRRRGIEEIKWLRSNVTEISHQSGRTGSFNVIHEPTLEQALAFYKAARVFGWKIASVPAIKSELRLSLSYAIPVFEHAIKNRVAPETLLKTLSEYSDSIELSYVNLRGGRSTIGVTVTNRPGITEGLAMDQYARDRGLGTAELIAKVKSIIETNRFERFDEVVATLNSVD